MTSNTETHTCRICKKGETEPWNTLYQPCVCTDYAHKLCVFRNLSLHKNECKSCKAELKFDFVDNSKMRKIIRFDLMRLIVSWSVFYFLMIYWFDHHRFLLIFTLGLTFSGVLDEKSKTHVWLVFLIMIVFLFITPKTAYIFKTNSWENCSKPLTYLAKQRGWERVCNNTTDQDLVYIFNSTYDKGYFDIFGPPDFTKTWACGGKCLGGLLDSGLVLFKNNVDEYIPAWIQVWIVWKFIYPLIMYTIMFAWAWIESENVKEKWELFELVK